MHRSESWRCRLVDQNLGRVASSNVKRNIGGSGACSQRRIRKRCRTFEKFVTEGNEKADELANAGAMLDEGYLAEARATTMQQEREEVHAALQYAASFHCVVEEWKDCEELKPKPKEKWIFVDKKSYGTKHRTEWCAQANKYHCMRCGRGSKYTKMQGTMHRTKIFVGKFWASGESDIREATIW